MYLRLKSCDFLNEVLPLIAESMAFGNALLRVRKQRVGALIFAVSRRGRTRFLKAKGHEAG